MKLLFLVRILQINNMRWHRRRRTLRCFNNDAKHGHTAELLAFCVAHDLVILVALNQYVAHVWDVANTDELHSLFIVKQLLRYVLLEFGVVVGESIIVWMNHTEYVIYSKVVALINSNLKSNARNVCGVPLETYGHSETNSDDVMKSLYVLPPATALMDLNGYTTAIDQLEKAFERLSNTQLVVHEPPYHLDDNRVLERATTHVHLTVSELEQNLVILRQYVAELEAHLGDRKREEEAIHGVLTSLKAERAKLEQPNGKREAGAAEAEPAAKKANVTAAPVAAAKK